MRNLVIGFITSFIAIMIFVLLYTPSPCDRVCCVEGPDSAMVLWPFDVDGQPLPPTERTLASGIYKELRWINPKSIPLHTRPADAVVVGHQCKTSFVRNDSLFTDCPHKKAGE